MREIVDFAGVGLAVVVAVRVAGVLLKKLLTLPVLGEAITLPGRRGVVLWLVLTGAAVYLLAGANLWQTKDILAASRIAPEISRESIVTNSSLPEASEDCTDVVEVIGQLWGLHMSSKFDGLLGEEGALTGGVDLSEVSDVIEGAFAGDATGSSQPANEEYGRPCESPGSVGVGAYPASLGNVYHHAIGAAVLQLDVASAVPVTHSGM